MPNLSDPRLIKSQCSDLQPIKILHQNPWFSLKSRGDFFTIEPSFGVVLILPVVEGSSIVLVEVKRPVLNDMHSMEIPAGGLETGESPQDGALRELYEETGIKISANQLKQQSPLALSPRDPCLAYIYEAEISMDEFLVRAHHDEEISQVRLFNFAEVQRLLVSGEIYLAGIVGLLSRFLLKNLSAINNST
ncbi:MAG: NUDIX hydrolase [SAR324 cluster bacterium]|nr:NUDIX hydrolase [SAR324 cluster bacterium]